MQGMELPMVYAKRPNLNRQKIMLQDKRLVQAFDGTTGWLLNPMMGATHPRKSQGNIRTDEEQRLPGVR